MANSTGILSGLLDSPRKQRRFFIASGAIFLVGVVAFVSTVLLRGTSNAFPDTISSQPAKLAQKQTTVPVTKAQVDLMRTVHQDGRGPQAAWIRRTRSSTKTSRGRCRRSSG